jgi:hypothetical protein
MACGREFNLALLCQRQQLLQSLGSDGEIKVV